MVKTQPILLGTQVNIFIITKLLQDATSAASTSGAGRRPEAKDGQPTEGKDNESEKEN